MAPSINSRRGALNSVLCQWGAAKKADKYAPTSVRSGEGAAQEGEAVGAGRSTLPQRRSDVARSDEHERTTDKCGGKQDPLQHCLEAEQVPEKSGVADRERQGLAKTGLPSDGHCAGPARDQPVRNDQGKTDMHARKDPPYVVDALDLSSRLRPVAAGELEEAGQRPVVPGLESLQAKHRVTIQRSVRQSRRVGVDDEGGASTREANNGIAAPKQRAQGRQQVVVLCIRREGHAQCFQVFLAKRGLSRQRRIPNRGETRRRCARGARTVRLSAAGPRRAAGTASEARAARQALARSLA